VAYVPGCPEVEMGLSIPRETLRLVGDSAAPRLTATSVEEVYLHPHPVELFLRTGL
jgi:uncharacterized protein YbbK (DUF523 family)